MYSLPLITYEIKGFDPTSRHDDPELPFSVWHQTINHIGVHVVHAPEIYRRIDAGQAITLVDLDSSTYKGNIQEVKASVNNGKNFGGLPAALYNATITLRKEKEWQESFLHFIDNHQLARLTPQRFQWSNVRLLRRPHTNLYMQASVYNKRIALYNQETGYNNDEPLKTTRLSAPAISDTDKAAQLVHSIDCLTAMMCVAHSLGKNNFKSPSGAIIITPDGPLYRNPDTGDYVHRLRPETIAVSSSKQPEKKYPGFDELFGIEDIRAQLEHVVLFYKRPELAAKWRVQRPGNILLHGPPGTGKTAVVHALAQAIGAEVAEISPADIYGAWTGDSEKAIKAIFDKVRKAKKPTILLLDEMEGIVNVVESDGSGSRTTNAVAGIFKTESAKVTAENPNVILAATTNDTSRLDPALIRAGRFDLQLSMSPPNDEARRQIFGNLILNYHSLDVDALAGREQSLQEAAFNPYGPALLEADSLSELVRITDHDFTAADIIEALRRASIAKASEEERTGSEPAPIDLTFLKGIILSMRRNRP